MTSKTVDYSSRDFPYGLDEQCGVGNSYDLGFTTTMINTMQMQQTHCLTTQETHMQPT